MIRPFRLWGAPLIIVALSVLGVVLSAGPSQVQRELALIGQPRAAAIELLGEPAATADSAADLGEPPWDAFAHSTRPIEGDVLLYQREGELLHVYLTADGTVATLYYGERAIPDD